MGAGDIANCSLSGDEATAKLLDGISGTVFTLGDNAYPNGSATDFANCYEPTWGGTRRARCHAPGNHEYQTANAAGYFGYFGSAAGDPTKGYYSYNLGDWHIVVLNSNSNCDYDQLLGRAHRRCSGYAPISRPTRSPCTLAYWHHPRFNSGPEPRERRQRRAVLGCALRRSARTSS